MIFDSSFVGLAIGLAYKLAPAFLKIDYPGKISLISSIESDLIKLSSVVISERAIA